MRRSMMPPGGGGSPAQTLQFKSPGIREWEFHTESTAMILHRDTEAQRIGGVHHAETGGQLARWPRRFWITVIWPVYTHYLGLGHDRWIIFVLASKLQNGGELDQAMRNRRPVCNGRRNSFSANSEANISAR